MDRSKVNRSLAYSRSGRNDGAQEATISHISPSGSGVLGCFLARVVVPLIPGTGGGVVGKNRLGLGVRRIWRRNRCKNR